MLRQAGLAAVLAGLFLFPAGSALGSGGTTGVLVNTACSGSQVAVGRGCYDQGNGSAWQVHEGSATWTDQTFNVNFTYAVPGTVGPDGGAVNLTVTANDVTNGSGILGQICAKSTFGISDSDPCARGYAKTPGSSQSGSKTLHLSPATGGAGATETVTILVGSGNVVFTYKSQGTSGSGSSSGGTHITYSYHADLSDSDVAIHLSGSGGFRLTHLPSANASAAGFDAKGSAFLQFVKAKGTYTIGLALKSVRYSFPQAGFHRVVLVYTVTRSSVRSCVAVGSTITVTATDELGSGTVDFGRLCHVTVTNFMRQTVLVSIRQK